MQIKKVASLLFDFFQINCKYWSSLSMQCFYIIKDKKYIINAKIIYVVRF